MSKHEFTIKKIYGYYGYPQARRTYEIKSEYFNVRIEFYGNQGYDFPKVECLRKCNGYFEWLNTFMKVFYQGSLDKQFKKLSTNETVKIEIQKDFISGIKIVEKLIKEKY